MRDRFVFWMIGLCVRVASEVFDFIYLKKAVMILPVSWMLCKNSEFLIYIRERPCLY